MEGDPLSGYLCLWICPHRMKSMLRTVQEMLLYARAPSRQSFCALRWKLLHIWYALHRLVIISAKRVGELHALEISLAYMCWWPCKTRVTLWLHLGFVPQVISSTFFNQSIGVYHEGELAECLLLCAAHTLQYYLNRTLVI